MICRDQIQIRDPFVLADERVQKYYLYGTTDINVWEGKAEGFDVYVSEDLENWQGPYPAFRPASNFWADENYWAPEVYLYKEKYVMFASFKAENKCRGVQILISDHPTGPFVPHSDGPVTPPEWECLDGTLYVDEHGGPWMVFCHEWLQVQDGEICLLPLSKDLRTAALEPALLFRASDAPWVVPVAGKNNSESGNSYVTDGPFLHRTQNGQLVMLWSSYGQEGYAIGVARSLTGEITGPWMQEAVPLFQKDGGHGMLFHTFDGRLLLALHRPNQTLLERPCFLPIEDTDQQLQIKPAYTPPLIQQRADPWIYKHTDGFYYFTASVPEFDRIEIRRAATISELTNAVPTVIWTKHHNGSMSTYIWAPELHYMDGKWYIYFAAGGSDDNLNEEWEHRMYVLESESADPLESSWTEKGQLRTNWDSVALDATTFEYEGVRYLVWAQKDPAIEGNSNLYIAEMDSPWTIRGQQVLISKPEYEWEKGGYWVNEGPAVIEKDGRLYMTFSASATDARYCIGQLTCTDPSRLLNKESWSKLPAPVFQSNREAEEYGPGHNCFTISEDDSETILVYHSREYEEITGDPLFDPNRHTRTKVLLWNEDGSPNFG